MPAREKKIVSVLLRLDSELKEKLEQEALPLGLSMNQLCALKLKQDLDARAIARWIRGED
jgi:predicted HicB family RNase H-like nuclease